MASIAEWPSVLPAASGGVTCGASVTFVSAVTAESVGEPDCIRVPGGAFVEGFDFEPSARAVVVFSAPLPAVDPAGEPDCAWVPGGAFVEGSGFEPSARAAAAFSAPLPVVDWVVDAGFLAVIWSVPFTYTGCY